MDILLYLLQFLLLSPPLGIRVQQLRDVLVAPQGLRPRQYFRAEQLFVILVLLDSLLAVEPINDLIFVVVGLRAYSLGVFVNCGSIAAGRRLCFGDFGPELFYFIVPVVLVVFLILQELLKRSRLLPFRRQAWLEGVLVVLGFNLAGDGLQVGISELFVLLTSFGEPVLDLGRLSGSGVLGAAPGGIECLIGLAVLLLELV